MNCGSGDSLKLSTRCGFRPKARQILEIADCDIPSAAAIDLVDQCVALGGCSSSVVTITASTCASVIVRGAPGRGSSCSPSSRHCAKRRRHLPTVTGWQSSTAAIALFDVPSAAARTMRQRSASAWADVGRRAHRSSVSRSSSLRTMVTVGRPIRVLMTLQSLPHGAKPRCATPYPLCVAITTQDTSRVLKNS